MSGWGVNWDFSIRVKPLHREQDATVFACSVIFIPKAQRSLSVISLPDGIGGAFIFGFLSFAPLTRAD